MLSRKFFSFRFFLLYEKWIPVILWYYCTNQYTSCHQLPPLHFSALQYLQFCIFHDLVFGILHSLEQWFSTGKVTGESYLGTHQEVFFLPKFISCLVQKSPVALTANVAFIWHLSTTALTRTLILSQLFVIIFNVIIIIIILFTAD